MKSMQRRHYELLTLLFAAVSSIVLFGFLELEQSMAALFFHPEWMGDVWHKQHGWLWKALYDYAFPFIVTAGGAALLVNRVVKDRCGRQRQLHAQAFGSQYAYNPPLKIGHTPDKSFVCGHCWADYAVFALTFLAQQYKSIYFVLALGLPWTLGFSRMTSGGHYLSDVFGSGYPFFLLAFALYYGWYWRCQQLAIAAEQPATI
ncbi:MAG: phosphatase PAP2 family protein [Methylomonas sp.]